MKSSCRLKLSLSTPTSPPIQLASTTVNCSTSLHAFTHLQAHTYYNVCAALLVEKGSSPRAQCLLAAAPRYISTCILYHIEPRDISTYILHIIKSNTTVLRLRTAPRSVMPLLLTLVFLALGIACLTVSPTVHMISEAPVLPIFPSKHLTVIDTSRLSGALLDCPTPP